MPDAVRNVIDFGHTLTEYEVKAGLRKLNPTFTFDPGAKLGIYHPRQDQWQGIWHNERHITSMSRGTIPEYHVWSTAKDKQGNKRIVRIEMIGWRHTFQQLVRAKIHNVTWRSLCATFNVPFKYNLRQPAGEKKNTVEIA